MRRRFTPWIGQKLRLMVGSVQPDRLGAGVLIVIGAFHLAVVLSTHSAPASLAPRFTLVIALAFLGFILVATMSISFLATSLVVVPTIQLGTTRAAGIEFNPTLLFGVTLSIGLLVRLFSQQVVYRRTWTSTGTVAVWTIVAATVAVVFSSIANAQSLSNSMPWFVAAGIALTLILSARFGYLSPNVIPVALLIGFSITATSDLRLYLRGTVVDTGLNAGRFVGGLGDYELLGEYYVVAIIIALATLVRVHRLAITLLALYVIGLGFILVFATHSRSPAIILAIACPLLLLTQFTGRNVSKPRSALIIAIAVSVVMALTGLISSSNTLARLLNIATQGDFAQTLNRSVIWPIVVTDPKFLSAGLFGNGPVGISEWFGTYPHNLVLWAYWSLGIFGLTFAGLMVATGISGLIQLRKDDWVTALLGFALILLLIDEAVIEFPREESMILFVLPLCALVGAASIAERSESLGYTAV